MYCIVMPGGKDSAISYRVKCVLVESERAFGDVLVAQQTRNRIYRLDPAEYPKASRRRLSNLTKKILESPDFMALNRKPINRELKVEVTAVMPISNGQSTTERRQISVGNGRDNTTAAWHVNLEKRQKSYPLPMLREPVNQEVVVSSLVDRLLMDIYGYPRNERSRSESDSTASSYKLPSQHRYLRRARLIRKTKKELCVVLETLRIHVNHAGGMLVRQLQRRDYLVAKRDKHYDVITAHLQAYSAKRSEDTRMRFSLTPQPGESGFTQWLDAMKMVARLQGGIPQEFRKRLWLTLAERHLEQRGVDWKQAEKLCFNEWSNPDDEELGIQIVKDLHRTGCSLFCGAAGRDNQAVLRRVLLGYARWNKSVGYCQGLNVLAALVLQVTDRAESSAVKVMIYLIEGVLPEGYFADNLRGLSIDMAVFRDLLRMRLPKLSRHLEALQSDAKDKATGSSYEPPLTNVFTMQWFLTLFCHCLPQEAVLRVWDLIFLEGDEVLLRTALAIWEGISDRIMTVTSADEFYSIMGVLTREMLEFTDVNNLIKTIVNMGPLYGVTDLREKHRYNITPWARRLSEEEETDTEDEERLAVAAAMFGVPQRFKKDRSNTSSSALQTIGPASERERIALDISTLKHQYAKLRERQRQAHIILSAACARQSMVPSTSQAMNHLLVGKSALVSAKTRQLGPPPGAIPPKPRTPVIHSPRIQGRRDKQGVTLHWKDTKKSRETKDEPPVGDETETTTTSVVSTTEGMSVTLISPKHASAHDSDSDSTSTELCDEPDRMSDVDSEEPTSTSDCYVMATDDEKSPRPGASPTAGDPPIDQKSDQQAATRGDSAGLQVQGLPSDPDVHPRREFLDVEGTSSSIAKITDQIRRLSASDEINSPSTVRDDEKTGLKSDDEDGEKVLLRNDGFADDGESTAEKPFVEISPVRDTTAPPAEAEFKVTDQGFEKLDSYDFLSSSVDSAVTDSYKNVAAFVKKKIVATNDGFISDDLMRDPELSSSSAIGEIPRSSESGKILGTESTRGSTDCGHYDKDGLKSIDWTVANCSKYNDDSATVSLVSDQSESNIGERKFYPRSYVGHLPIAPATVNEKLSKAAVELSPLKDNVTMPGKGVGNYDVDLRTNTSFDSVSGEAKLGKAGERIFGRDVASFDTGVGTKINTSFESDSLRTSSRDSYATLDSGAETKINNSFESFLTSDKVSVVHELSPISDNATITSKDIGSLESEIPKKIDPTFDPFSTIDKAVGPAELSPTSDVGSVGKDGEKFDSIISRNTDTNFGDFGDIGLETKTTKSMAVLTKMDSPAKETASFRYDVYRSVEAGGTSSTAISREIEITDLSPSNSNDRVLNKDIATFDAEVRKLDATFDHIEIVSSDSKTTDTLSLYTGTDSLKNSSEMTCYKVPKSVESSITFGIPKSTEMRLTDASPSSETATKLNSDLDHQDYSIEKKVPKSPEAEFKIGCNIEMKLSKNSESESKINTDLSVPGNIIDKVPSIDYSVASSTDRSSGRPSPPPSVDRKISPDERRTDANLSLIGIGATGLSSDYFNHDCLSAKAHDDQKRSPRTPESTNSFSSGETMGPDSKASSLTTSPRTPNRSDSRNFPNDKSALSSLSSDSKTLTLRSMDSDVAGNRTKLDRKSHVARASLDKSSPSTPISSDSLRNKSEISPKFVISSSSESCSPCKAKSSERSFSSELQSPISANSIKYRTSYADGQDNLSESPMDVCSATSPFYPIVYPNQKTPSPYSANGKQENTTGSSETSPEQKSTSSKEDTPSNKRVIKETSKALKRSDAGKSSKDRNDDYDSARPFEKELAETLSTLPSEIISRTKNERISTVSKGNLGSYSKKTTVETLLEDESTERYMETDTVSPLPGDKYEIRSAFVDKAGGFKGLAANERDQKYLLGSRDSLKPFERSCSSLDKRFGEMKSSTSSNEFGTNTHKKRSSDILEDLRHLEAIKTSKDGKADTSMLTRKTGYDWEDLKNLEARRQDNFSDSASGFSRGRLDVPSINVFGESRKSYVVEPKINLEECSILKSYARKKSNGEPDDDRESKLGVWTKVKPRAGRDNGRRSSDRALKIIQENSAILHKILTCQAKKRLPDLEEISKEITISPINEEISKIFSPILEKMGLNEHEINEELARINFKDFDQMTVTSGSEFDAKMNDELCKLSLIDDSEIVDHLAIDDVASRDYLDTREALIDRQINEELSKLLANYEGGSSASLTNRDEASSRQNPSELEGLEISSISNNVFSYHSSNDSIETKSELGSMQDPVMQPEHFSQYTENVMSNFAQPAKYSLRGMSPRSDIDIYRELEKLDKISSGEIFPSASSSLAQKIISPISYPSELPVYPEVRPSSLEYTVKPEKSFDPSPMKSPYDTYKPYDFKSRISPRKTPSNPYSVRSYEKPDIDESFEFHENPTTPSRLYDLGTSRPILSKETLEFRVRYDDDDTTKQIRDDDLSLEPYQTNLVDLDRGASYYTDETPISLKRLTTETERTHNTSVVTPLDYTYNPPDFYSHKYDPVPTKSYAYASPTTGYEKQSYDLDHDPETGSYLPMRRKNSHSMSPNYHYADREFAASINQYSSDLSPSIEDPSKRPVSHPEFAEKISVANYTEVPSRDSISFRKASLSLGPLDGTTARNSSGVDTTPSPRSLFSPFPVRNSTRKRKELGLKLGLYSPSSPGSTSLKRT